MMKDNRPEYLKKEDPKFILTEADRDKSLNRKYVLAHMGSGRRIDVIAEGGGIVMEDCAILLKQCTRHNIEAWDYAEVEFFMIPPRHVMYEVYTNDANYDVVEVDYFFDPYEFFLEDIKGVMEKENWESSKISETLEKIKEQMKLSEKPYNPAEYTVIPENSI